MVVTRVRFFFIGKGWSRDTPRKQEKWGKIKKMTFSCLICKWFFVYRADDTRRVHIYGKRDTGKSRIYSWALRLWHRRLGGHCAGRDAPPVEPARAADRRHTSESFGSHHRQACLHRPMAHHASVQGDRRCDASHRRGDTARPTRICRTGAMDRRTDRQPALHNGNDTEDAPARTP